MIQTIETVITEPNGEIITHPVQENGQTGYSEKAAEFKGSVEGEKNAFDLFTQFTADVIRANSLFVR